MLGLTWLKALPWLISAALAASLAFMSHLYLGKRDELVTLQASVKVLGDQAEAKVKQAKIDGENNLKKVTNDHEQRLPQIRSNAVANYLARLRNASSSSGELPSNSASVKMDDGTGTKCIPDSGFIADAADDAGKVEAWREWCELNKCPVEN